MTVSISPIIAMEMKSLCAELLLLFWMAMVNEQGNKNRWALVFTIQCHNSEVNLIWYYLRFQEKEWFMWQKPRGWNPVDYSGHTTVSVMKLWAT